MSEFKPNISDLFTAAFGTVGIPVGIVNVPLEEAKGGAVVFKTPQIPAKEKQQLSHLRTPIFHPITLKGDNYNVYDKDGNIVVKTLIDFRLPLSTLVDFSRSKIKRKTRVVGNGGAVIESYGNDNWKIRFRGLIFKTQGHPQGANSLIEQHNRLLGFEELVDSVAVSGDYFTEKGINNISIDKIDFKQIQGKPDVLAYTMTCESDEPLELINF